MLIGHAGIALLLRYRRPQIKLAWLLGAAFLPDLVRIPLELAVSPVNREMFSHSLPAVAALGLAVGAFGLLRGAPLAVALTLAIASLSHWPADVFTGCKPISIGYGWIGFFGYRHPIADLVVEGGLFLIGWKLLRRADDASSLQLRWPKLIVALCLALQVAFLASMYVDAEFFIERTEWLWYPSTELVPRQRPLEHLGCHAPER